MEQFIEVPFEILKGKTFKSIEGLHKGSFEVIFTTTDGEVYLMRHEQECCECVCIEDVCGDVEDLLYKPVLIAEESTNSDVPYADVPDDLTEYESFMWTFYKLATINGYVDIRWIGGSNGYYSEGVSLLKILDKDWFKQLQEQRSNSNDYTYS